jgi:hypothetical protein
MYINLHDKILITTLDMVTCTHKTMGTKVMIFELDQVIRPRVFS